jgi:hypothetical protein
MVDRLKTIRKKDWIKMNYTGASLETEAQPDPPAYLVNKYKSH